MDRSGPAGFDLILSLQAVHDLRHASRIPKLYGQLHNLLAPGGTIMICDHVNSSSPYGAAHFTTVEEHLWTFSDQRSTARLRTIELLKFPAKARLLADERT